MIDKMRAENLGYWVVTKAPVGLAGTAELIGMFSKRERARAACAGVGTYQIAKVTMNHVYQNGTLLDVEVRVVTSIAAIKTDVDWGAEGGHGPGLHPRSK